VRKKTWKPESEMTIEDYKRRQESADNFIVAVIGIVGFLIALGILSLAQ